MKRKLVPLALLAGLSTQASAFQLDTNEDWSIRWDNTLKYNAMMRVATRDADVYAGGSQPFAAQPDASFDRGDLVSNRFDILSEFDVVWKDKLGFRVSAAGWYDHAYHNGTNAKGADSGVFNSPNSWPTALSADWGELNDDEKRLHYRGGEILDAFVFWNWQLGDVVGNLRVGRHVIYWGQSLLGTGALSTAGGAMNPLDFSKALSVPGSEAKELFRPTGKISTLMQLTDNLSMSAYYTYDDWEPTQIPRGNTYFSPAAGFTDHVDFVFLAPGAALRMEDQEEPGSGEWGVQFAYWVEDWSAEISAYFINYHDKLQNGLQVCLNNLQGGDVGCNADGVTPLGGPFVGWLPTETETGTAVASLGRVKWTFAEDVKLWGLSFTKQIGDNSYGLDLVYRENAPIRDNLTAAITRTVWSPLYGGRYDAAAYDAADAGHYRSLQAKTLSLVVNTLGLLNDNGLWEGGNYIVELTFNTVLDFDNWDNGFYNGGETPDNQAVGAPSFTHVREDRIQSHIAILFNPTWYQVTPGVDMTLRAGVSIGIDGNGPWSFSGDEESGNATIGLDFNVDQLWSWSIKYNAFFGPVPNAFGNLLKDRDNIAFTIKRTF